MTSTHGARPAGHLSPFELHCKRSDFHSTTGHSKPYTLVFSLTVNDGNSASSADTVSITVSADNDAPTVTSAIADATTAEDSSYSVNAASAFTDVDDSMTYTMSEPPTPEHQRVLSLVHR